MDAIDVIKSGGGYEARESIVLNGKVLLKMLYGLSYTTSEGTKFTKERPFNVVSESVAFALVNTDQFELGDPEEAKKFFGIK